MPARFDLVVYGATPGGIASAVRAARDGLTVALVDRSGHLGGFLTSGLGVMDTMYDGRRAALYDEFCELIVAHYRDVYGEESAQLRDVQPNAEWPLRVEPGVAERILGQWVGRESITVLLSRPLVAVERRGAAIAAISVEGDEGTERLEAEVFVDGTYEADLAAAAGAPYRVGREGRNEYDEPHAGRIFTRQAMSADGLPAWPVAAVRGDLNLRGFKSVSQEIFAGSTGVGDGRVQAYSYRVTLSADPANRRIPEVPEGYDAEVYRAIDTGKPIGPPNLPNRKRFWFRNLTGGSAAYPDADEAEREVIRARHRDFALGYLYFLQHDEIVPDAVRAEAREYGLALDEYPDNDNFPYEFYVREARRVVGPHVFTEHDASIAPGLERTPVHADSIGFAEWFMDSHEVSDETQPGSSQEGKILLTEATRPSQLPFRILFANGLDNLLVPVAMSSTHVGWGTLRLEPVWMHTGEVAGRAASLAIAAGRRPRAVDVDALQRSLLADGTALGFFNDVDIADGEPWTGAVNYFATRGFFPSYDARPRASLTVAVARVWTRAWADGSLDDDAARRTALNVVRAETDASPAVTASEFATLAEAAALLHGRRVRIASLHTDSTESMTRGAACVALFDAVP
jgi:hypothetical protein